MLQLLIAVVLMKIKNKITTDCHIGQSSNFNGWESGDLVTVQILIYKFWNGGGDESACKSNDLTGEADAADPDHILSSKITLVWSFFTSGVFREG